MHQTSEGFYWRGPARLSMRSSLALALVPLALVLCAPTFLAPMSPVVAPAGPHDAPLYLPSNLFAPAGGSCVRSSDAPVHPSSFPISIAAAGTGASATFNDATMANNTAVNSTITAPSNPSLSNNQYIVLGVGDPVSSSTFTAVGVAETYYLVTTVAAPAAYLPNNTLIYNPANLVGLGTTHTFEINHVGGYWWKYTYDGSPVTGTSAWENGTYNLGVSVAVGVMCEAGYTLGPSFVGIAYGSSGAATPTIPTTVVPWAVGVEPLGHTSTDYTPAAANAVPQLNTSLGVVGIQGHAQDPTLGINHVRIGSSIPYAGALASLWGKYKVIILNQSAISPVTATVGLGGSHDFNATAFDQNGAWVPRAHYAWQVTPASLGTLNTTTGSAVKFTAGGAVGSGIIWANVSYNCSAIHDEANITVALVGAPTIDNFTAWRPSIVLGDTTHLNVNASWPVPLTYSYVGLPAGCSSVNATSLACRPTSAGTYNVRVYVNDTPTHSSSALTTLYVYPDLSISSFMISPSTLTFNTSTTVTVVAVGGIPTLIYTYTGMPSGCNGNQPATFRCIPKSSGTFTPRVYVNDSAGHTQTRTTTLKVNAPIQITGFAYSQNPVPIGGSTYINITATGGTPPYHYLYTLLPPGCTSLDTPSLLCTPTATGSYAPSVNVTDSSGAFALGASPLSVGAVTPIVVSTFSASPNPVAVGQSTTFSVAATGGSGPLTYAYTGLPTGCTSANTSSLACTPTVTGAFSVTVSVQDTTGHSGTKGMSLVVNPAGAAPTISSFTATPSSIQLGNSTTIQVVASGGTGTLSYSYRGLPAGCASTLASFTCTPTVAGTFTITVNVTDTASRLATSTTTLRVTPASGGGGLTITSFSALPPSLSTGSTTDLSVSASGGTGTLSYAYTGLPGGCSSSDLAALACTPSSAGTFTVRVYVNDSAGHSASATTTLTVSASSSTTPSGTSYGSLLPLLLIAVVAVVAVVAAVLLLRRRRRGPTTPSGPGPVSSSGGPQWSEPPPPPA